MFAVSWPGSDASLVFSAPFGGLSPYVRALAVLGVFALGFFLIAWLYRAESKLIPRRFRVALLALRLLAFALVLGTLLFEPVLSKTVREDVPGKVVIGLDTSDSMRVTDPHRTPWQKIHLARVLRLLPDVGDALLRDYESRCRGVDVPEFPGGPTDPEKKKFDEVIAQIDAIPRLEHALKVLGPEGLDLVSKLREKHAVEIIGFGQDLIGLPLDADRRRASVPNGPLDSTKVNTPVYTDLKLPLARAAETAGDAPDAAGPKLLGVILLSDGRHNWGEGPAARVADLAARKASVNSIILAPVEPPPDVAIVQAKAQSATVFKGSTVPVEISVRVTGMPPGEIPVKLVPPDGKPVTEKIRHNGQDQVHQLSLKVTLDEPGPQVLTVTADPPLADKFPGNNTRATRVNVVKDRARVMLIDGEARWEFHYLHTCLGRDPNMDVRSIVFRQPRIGRGGDEELKKSGIPARSMPDDAEVLTAYDCVVLGDTEPDQLSTTWRERIEKYVAESGGTLVMVAGKRAMPLAYSGTDDDPLRKLLPIKSPKIVGSDDGFGLGLTAEGDRAWFISMGDSG